MMVNDTSITYLFGRKKRVEQKMETLSVDVMNALCQESIKLEMDYMMRLIEEVTWQYDLDMV